MSASLREIADRLAAAAPAAQRLRLRFGECRIDVESNDRGLLDWLERYFAAFDDGSPPASPPTFVVRAHQMPPPELGLRFRAWSREPGKDRGKEAFVDLRDGRVVRKVRTGMHFLVSRTLRVAFGDCLRNSNQVVNFINFQYTSWHMNRGRVLCHAAGVADESGRGLALASLSGGGKSTLALRLLGCGFDFTSNDRVLVAATDESGLHEMVGVPKHPRINPGTILNDPRLAGLLPAERRSELSRLPREALWELEEKYDAPIDQLYGPGRVRVRAPLHGLLALAWSPRREEPARFERVVLAEAPDVLDAIMKSPGPFFLPEGREPATGYEPPDPAPYLEALAGLPVVVARGGVDFDQGVQAARALLEEAAG